MAAGPVGDRRRRARFGRPVPTWVGRPRHACETAFKVQSARHARSVREEKTQCHGMWGRDSLLNIAYMAVRKMLIIPNSRRVNGAAMALYPLSAVSRVIPRVSASANRVEPERANWFYRPREWVKPIGGQRDRHASSNRPTSRLRHRLSPLERLSIAEPTTISTSSAIEKGPSRDASKQ
ncbi:uncharacterized protein LY79DRAFT_559239 [Colletotrichum navitas]|uniref:Uncharacterized protein n=1 Tax=Colletotrichum navitas TaxID=681940 RepID=A0AAD8PUV1_9PEZI|nr:uncharacterized protein LY79DRAFT_559239 [Colletotrichum navitas]KAK1585109.1 hypothetical protein LY79DRAFT_559239 [Colletotrichum navitas]